MRRSPAAGRSSSATTPPTRPCSPSCPSSTASGSRSAGRWRGVAGCFETPAQRARLARAARPGGRERRFMRDHGLDLGRGRQRAHGGARRPAGAHRLVVRSALRRRPAVLPPARRRRGEGLHRRRARRHGGLPVRVSAQHRGRRHDAHRPAGQCGAHHRFRAALPAVRPHVSAAAAVSHHRAGRACRASPSGCGRPTTTAGRSRAIRAAAITSAGTTRRRCCG